MYALMGMALGYFSYRYNLPLTIRSALYPIFGKRINGPIGHSVDIATVIGTIFGIATTLGIGVVQLNYGLSVLFDIPDRWRQSGTDRLVGDHRHYRGHPVSIRAFACYRSLMLRWRWD